VAEAFAAEAVMTEAVMAGTLAAEAFAAEAVMAEAVMAGTLAFEAFASKAAMTEPMMAGTLTLGAFAAKAMMIKALMPRFPAVEAVMLEAVPRETLLLGAMLFTVMPGKTLMIELLVGGAGLRLFARLFGGMMLTRVFTASLGEALMAGALLGAIRMMEAMRGAGEDMFADFHGDLFFLGLADDRERGRAIFAGGTHQNLKLPGINDLLIIVELQHIETLQAGRGRRAIGDHPFHDQAEVFGQAELRGEDGRHRGGDDTDKGRRLGRRQRRVLEVARAFSAIRSTISLAPAFRRGAIGMVEMFAMLTVFGLLAIRRTLSFVLAGSAVLILAMPPEPISFARRVSMGGWRRRGCGRGRWRCGRCGRCGRGCRWRGRIGRGFCGRRRFRGCQREDRRGRRRLLVILGDRDRGAHGGSYGQEKF